MTRSANVLAEADLQIGHHITVQFLGMTFNADTIWSTAVAALIVIAAGFWLRAKMTSGVPSKVQVLWEMLIGWVTRQVESSLGHVNAFVVPLAVALFAFILIANWLEIVPSGEDPHYLPAPTSDINLTLALGLLVIFGVHIMGIRRRGVKAYVKHLFEPYAILFPINLIEELVKPFTLALRLFGNIFAGGLMIALIGLMPLYLIPFGFNAAWKLFDMLIGLIQAFIFALLTIIYFGVAGETHDEPGAEGEHPEVSPIGPAPTERAERVPAGSTVASRPQPAN